MRTEKFLKGLSDRNNQFGYGVIIFMAAGFCYLLVEASNWVIAGMIFVLLVVVLELSYRLSNKR